MGSFYTNITLHGPHQGQIVEALIQEGNRAYITPSGGDASKLCALMGSKDVEPAASILRSVHGTKGYLFEIQRHEELVRTLGLPSFTVGLSYKYIKQGEIPSGLDSDSLKHIG